MCQYPGPNGCTCSPSRSQVPSQWLGHPYLGPSTLFATPSTPAPSPFAFPRYPSTIFHHAPPSREQLTIYYSQMLSHCRARRVANIAAQPNSSNCFNYCPDVIANKCFASTGSRFCTLHKPGHCKTHGIIAICIPILFLDTSTDNPTTPASGSTPLALTRILPNLTALSPIYYAH